MQHSLHAEGFGVRLRPVRLEDAAFIGWLRNLEHAKGKVGDSAPDQALQRAWLEKYFLRPGDYYFIIETPQGLPVGAYGIYDQSGQSAESGRWVIRPEVPAAIPSALLGIELAFGTLGLRLLRVNTVSTNQKVLSLNRKFGFRQVRVQAGALLIGGQPVDLVSFELEAAAWPAVRQKLLPLAQVAQAQVLEWEQTQIQIQSHPQPKP